MALLVPSLSMARLRVTLSARGSGRLPPYLGSTLRGTFGHVFKRIGCAMPDPCVESCRRPGRCAYSYFFETPVPQSLASRLGSSFAPHPFVLRPLEDAGGPYNTGDRLSFELTLFGHGIAYLSYVLAGLEGMGALGLGGQRIPFILREAADTFDAVGRPLFDPSTHRVLGSPELRDLRDAAHGQARSPGASSHRLSTVKIRFLTPARLLRKGQLLRQPDLAELLRAIHRRLEALTHFHGDGAGAKFAPGDLTKLLADADVAELVKSSLVVVRLDRISNRQQRHVQLDGLLGEATYRRVLSSCLPWLRAGQWTHIGKATAFGLGQYSVEITA